MAKYKIIDGWVSYKSPNRKSFYKQKYSKLWNDKDVSVSMDFGSESIKNGIVGVNYRAFIFGSK